MTKIMYFCFLLSTVRAEQWIQNNQLGIRYFTSTFPRTINVTAFTIYKINGLYSTLVSHRYISLAVKNTNLQQNSVELNTTCV